MLDQAVWNDVRQLLSDPARMQRELQRRLEGDDADAQQEANKKLQAQANKVRRGIARHECVQCCGSDGNRSLDRDQLIGCRGGATPDARTARNC